MKKFAFTKFKAVATRIVIALILCLAVLIVPTAVIVSKISLSEQIRNVSNYQGIVELWNIDTFEGGTASKTSFLKERAVAFEKQNKGLFVMVKNMTPEECELALKQGHMPAMFSFGQQFSCKAKDLISPIEINAKIDSGIIKSATTSAGLLAVGYLKSAYVLCSTESRIASTTQSLSDQAFVCGTKKTLKNNKTRITYSLACGNALTSPQMCFENNFYPFVAGETTFDVANKTAYQAYCDFVEGKAKILLGTLRDVARIENRYALGKFDEPIYQTFGGLVDLVQYVAISKKMSADTKNACKKFIEFLVSVESQNKIKDIGLLSVRSDVSLYDSGIYQQIENAAKSNVFDEIFA